MTYVTSDLHGYPLEKFEKLLASAGFTEDDELYVLGDVIDRNGDGGVETLLWMMEQPNIYLLRGNHEQMLLDCSFLFEEINDINLDSFSEDQLMKLLSWMRNGAGVTIDSLRALKDADPVSLYLLLSYLSGTALYEDITVNGQRYILTHAGLGGYAKGKPLDSYTVDELLWHRPTPETRYDENAIVIFGHTPTHYISEDFRGRAFKTETWICTDTGAAGGGSPMLLRLDDGKEFYA